MWQAFKITCQVEGKTIWQLSQRVSELECYTNPGRSLRPVSQSYDMETMKRWKFTLYFSHRCKINDKEYARTENMSMYILIPTYSAKTKQNPETKRDIGDNPTL